MDYSGKKIQHDDFTFKSKPYKPYESSYKYQEKYEGKYK